MTSYSKESIIARNTFEREMIEKGNIMISELFLVQDIQYQDLVDAGLLIAHNKDGYIEIPMFLNPTSITLTGQIFFIQSPYTSCLYFKERLLERLTYYLSGNVDIGISISEFDAKYSFNGYIRTIDRKEIQLSFEDDSSDISFYKRVITLEFERSETQSKQQCSTWSACRSISDYLDTFHEEIELEKDKQLRDFIEENN